MEVKYNVTGTRRKELAQTVAEIIGGEAVYRFAPTFAFEVDFFTVTRDGTLEYPDGSDTEIVEQVLEGLAKAGFECEQDGDNAALEAANGEAANGEAANGEAAAAAAVPAVTVSEEAEQVGLTISVPLDKVNIENLTRMLDAKGGLIRKALAIDALPVEVGENAVTFPWFDELPDADDVNAYTHFISALCQLSKDQKRVTATAKDVENEKYAFRCFLLRLGFIGEDYKTERKVLMRNLSGSAAFRDGGRHAVSE